MLGGMETTAAPAAGEPSSLVSRYASQMVGQLGCFDRVIITGSLLEVCHPAALERQLQQLGIRCFDLGLFAEPLRDAMRDHAVSLARAAGLEVEFIQRRNFRKEDRIAEILQRRGDHPGLVPVFSAMAPCPAFRPWHDKKSGRTGVKITQGKCLHFYFYFVHERLGLCYLRVPTWLPFRLQFYFNGHAWLANELRRAGITFRMEDNAFVEIADWKAAQTLSDAFPIQALHADLNALARQYVPCLKQFPSGYYWSLMQVEYSWDLAWKRAADLAPVYAEISRQAILTVKAPDVAKFLGKRLSPAAELTSDFRTRIEGTRIRHTLGPASLKLYDKRGRVLRLECTANDVTFFKHYRKVEHRDGPPTYQVAALKKSLFSLGDLAGLMRAACARYLAFLSALEDRSGGSVNLERITEPARDEQHRSYRGFNFFAAGDLTVLLAILRGEYHISGLSNRLLQRVLTGKKGGQISRVLKRLRLHGLIRKIGHTYKYYVTALGQKALVAALKLREHLILPALVTPASPA
jgi:hypothetical protein